MARPFFYLLCAICASSFQAAAKSPLQPTDSTQYKAAVQHTLNLLSPAQRKLYNGYEYLGFKFNEKRGHPFFKSTTFTVGQLEYDGISYPNTFLLYDLVQDELVVEYLDRKTALALVRPKVANFTLLGHRFVYLAPGPNTPTDFQAGYYDQLFSAKGITVLGRYTKMVDGIIPEDKSVAYFPEKNRFYIQKGEEIFLIKNKRDVLKVFADKKKEIADYISDYDLSFSKDPAFDLVEVATYYTGLPE